MGVGLEHAIIPRKFFDTLEPTYVALKAIQNERPLPDALSDFMFMWRECFETGNPSTPALLEPKPKPWSYLVRRNDRHGEHVWFWIDADTLPMGWASRTKDDKSFRERALYEEDKNLTLNQLVEKYASTFGE